MDYMKFTKDIVLDTSWTTADDRSTTNEDRIANIIRHDVHFALDRANNLYYFSNGVYRENGEGAIAELYYRWLEECQSTRDWRPGRAKHIVENISSHTKYLNDRPPLEIINFKNGLYNWTTGKLYKHTPNYLSTIQIPIIYDPTATCPAWDEFLSEVLPVNGGPNYLREIIGLCMIPFTGLQKCIVLVGGGSNGKSTYLNGLHAAIGNDNICNISLHTLTNPSEKFARSGLVGKLVNIFGDMSTKKIEDAANFKPLIGEDRITIEYKGKHPFYYTPFAKLIFSCNEVVKSDDDSEGYKRRFVHIPFTRRFAVNPKKGLELKDSLSSPKELSGLLNLILPRIPEIVENGLTVTPEIAGIIDEWCPIPDSTKVWLESMLVEQDGAFLPGSAFYNYYCYNCPCVEPFERAKLVRYIKNLFPNSIPNTFKKVDGKTFRGYLNIAGKNMDVLDSLREHGFMVGHSEEELIN
jgi:putative DNA primase/helicase